MENEFVPYEEALALKELGFTETCLGFYNYNGFFQQLSHVSNNDFMFTEVEEGVISGKDGNFNCTAPLYQQAFRWFRENGKKLGLYGFGILSDGKYRYYYFYNDGFTKKSNDDFYGGKTLSTHEEAELACLRKLIEIVKNKK